MTELITEGPPGFRSGFVALCGRPNTGKSTLLNAIIGEKVAITSVRAQTTRTPIRGVLTRDDHQIVFIDTPGIHKPLNALGERLNDAAVRTLKDVDVAVMVVDASQPVGRGDVFVAKRMVESGVRLLCAVTKIDAVPNETLFPQLEAAGELAEFEEIVPVSAKRGRAIDRLHHLIYQRMPEGPPYFPEEMSTDQHIEFRIAELVREKALWLLHQEVPHSVAVLCERLETREDGVIEVECAIYVERDSQKGIVIGKGGQMLRGISMRARQELEELLGAKVFLRCQVKVRPDWQRDRVEIARMGY